MPRHNFSLRRIQRVGFSFLVTVLIIPSYGQIANRQHESLRSNHQAPLSSHKSNNVFQRKGDKSRKSTVKSRVASTSRENTPMLSPKSSSMSIKTSTKNAPDNKEPKTDKNARIKAKYAPSPETTKLTASVRSGLNLMDLLTNVTSGAQQPKALCQLNEAGSYGDLMGFQLMGGKSYIIRFSYYTSVATGAAASEVSQEILPSVDRAVATALLPKFFPCIKQPSQTSTRFLQEAPIDALSSMPMDVYVPVKSCPANLPETDCYIARGSLTVVARNVFDIVALENLVRVGIRAAFASGEILENIPTDQVKDMTYFGNDSDGLPPQTSRPGSNPPLQAPTEVFTMYPVSTGAPAFVMPPQISPVSPTPTNEPTGPVIQLTAAPAQQDLATSAPQSSSNVTEPAVSPIPQESAEAKKRPRWWIWLLAGLGGVLLFVFLLTLCEEVDKSSGNQDSKKKKRSEDNDERLGAAYIPPTEAAQAAAAHLRKHQSNFSAPLTSSAGVNVLTFTNGSDDSEEESKEEELESLNDEGSYGMVEIVEEEEEDDGDDGSGGDDDAMSSYVEEEVSEGEVTWTNGNDASYGSTY